MVCAESSASFSKTAAFLMSSLGEATERVTSMVQYWHSLCGSARPSVGRRRGRCPVGAEIPGDLLRHRGSLCAHVGRHGNLFQRPESKTGPAVEDEAASAKK